MRGRTGERHSKGCNEISILWSGRGFIFTNRDFVEIASFLHKICCNIEHEIIVGGGIFSIKTTVNQQCIIFYNRQKFDKEGEPVSHTDKA